MRPNNDILVELEDLKSSLGEIRETANDNLYVVPVSYFEELADKIMNRIKAIEEEGFSSPLLLDISKEMPNSFPCGYFESLPDNLLALVKSSNQVDSTDISVEEELATLSPLLSGLNKKMPNSVPAGYFENLHLPVVEKPEAKVIEMRSRRKVVGITGRKWFRYAAAAVVAGIIAVTGFVLVNQKTTEVEAGGKALAEFTLDVKKMNEPQKDSLLAVIDNNLSLKQDVAINSDHNDVKTLLQGISDEELKDFQEQTEDMEDVLMTN